jgi:hypothetical protein
MTRYFDTFRALYLNNSFIFNKSYQNYNSRNIYTYHSLCRSESLTHNYRV